MLSIAGISRQIAFEKKQDKLNPRKTAPHKIILAEDFNHLCYTTYEGTEVPTETPKAPTIVNKINRYFKETMKKRKPRSVKELIATGKL